MPKLLHILPLALVFSLGLAVGCDEDDPSFSNRESCENWLNTYNELSCVADNGIEIDAESTCGAYEDGASVDCSAIFDCWAANMECEDLGNGVETVNNYTEGCPTSCE